MLRPNPGQTLAKPWPFAALTIYRRNDPAVRTADWRYIRYSDGSEELYQHP